MPFGLFDNFVEGVFSGFVTYVFNGTEVTTGVASSPVYPEDSKPNTVNNTLVASIITGNNFHDELMEKIKTSSYAAFKRQFAENDFMSFVSSKLRDFPNFIKDNLPRTLLDFPHGPTKKYFDFTEFSSGAVFVGCIPLRFESWLYSYLREQYRYEPVKNNVFDKTYAKNTWVGIKQVDVYVPGKATDYREGFFEHILEQRYYPSNGDDYLYKSVVTVHYGATTTTTSTTAYTAPELTAPIVLEGTYTVPALAEPVVLTGNEVTTTVPVEPYMVITYEWRPGGHRSTNPMEESTETVVIPSWVFTTTANYWQVTASMWMVWEGPDTSLIGPNDHWQNYGQAINLFWIYEDKSGVYPAWDNYTGITDAREGFRQDRHYIDSIRAGYYYYYTTTWSDGYNKLVDPETSPEQYAIWEADAKKYGLNPLAILNQLKNSIDLTDNYRTAFEMGVSLTTQDPKLIKYIYKLFKHWKSLTSYIPIADFGNVERITSLRFNLNSIGTIEREFFFTGISTETKTGTFSTAAKKGDYLKVTGSYNESFTDNINAETYSGSWQGLKIYHQITDTTYEILRVGFPLCAYDSRRDAVFGAEPTDHRFILPIHIDIAWEMGSIDFEYLIHKSMRLTQVIAVVRRINWMELPVVQDMFEIIKVGLEILQYWGYATGVYSIMTSFAVNFVSAVIISAVINFGIEAAFELIVQELGVEAGLIIAVMLAGTGVAAGINGTEFMGGLIDGTMLLSAGNNLVTLVNEERMESVKTGYKQLEYDKEEFGEFYEEQIKDIEEARDLLKQPNYLSPYLLIGKAPMQVWGEGPQSFYERTVHSGNIGTKAFDFVHDYTRQKLTLPTFEQTVGDTLYVP